jgi:delta24-sterol reductase
LGLPFGNHPLFRYTLGWTLPLNPQFIKMLAPTFAYDLMARYNHFIQDFVIPMDKTREILELAHKELEVSVLSLILMVG